MKLLDVITESMNNTIEDSEMGNTTKYKSTLKGNIAKGTKIKTTVRFSHNANSMKQLRDEGLLAAFTLKRVLDKKKISYASYKNIDENAISKNEYEYTFQFAPAVDISAEALESYIVELFNAYCKQSRIGNNAKWPYEKQIKAQLASVKLDLLKDEDLKVKEEPEKKLHYGIIKVSNALNSSRDVSYHWTAGWSRKECSNKMKRIHDNISSRNFNVYVKSDGVPGKIYTDYEKFRDDFAKLNHGARVPSEENIKSDIAFD